jgi:hypothetical protein
MTVRWRMNLAKEIQRNKRRRWEVLFAESTLTLARFLSLKNFDPRDLVSTPFGSIA